MTRIFLIFLFLFSFLQGAAQGNLVPNPGFEDTVSCPSVFYDEVDKAQGWSAFRESPDYAHVCAGTVPFAGGLLSYQTPVSGDAYMGFVAGDAGFNIREHIGAQLVHPLVIGQRYYVSMHVILADNRGACNKIGATFSTIPYNPGSPSPINNAAQLYTNTIITDSLNWTKLSGTFIADSAYSYIILGNFFDDMNTSTAGIGSDYYFLDDICVATDSSFCYPQEETGFVPNIFSPNGDGINDLIDFSHLHLVESVVTIYNRWGNEVFHTTQYQKTWDGRQNNGADCAEGVYFYIQHSTGITNKEYDLRGCIQLVR